MIAPNIPKISVILPVFNVDTNIRQCLDSIKTQTLEEIEVIIVNDCSGYSAHSRPPIPQQTVPL